MTSTKSRKLSRAATRIEVESPTKKLSQGGRAKPSKLNLAKPFTSRSQRLKPFNPEDDYNFDSSDDEDNTLKASNKDDGDVPSKSAARGRAIYQKLCSKYGYVVIKNLLKQIGRNAITLVGQHLSRKELRAFFVSLIEAYVNDEEDDAESRELRLLEFDGNRIGVREIDYITDFANAYTPLVHVLLKNCRLCSRGLQNLSMFLRTNRTLQTLDLSGNKFTDNDGRYIADIIETAEYITELRVSRNELRESGTVIGEALANNTGLKVLDLSWNHLRGNGAIGICKGLAKNQALETINLSWNGFGFEGSAAMGYALKDNTALVSLDISNNRIYPQAVFELLKGLEQNKALSTLKLGGNPITANMTSIILTKIQQCKESNLKELDLEGIVVDKDFNDILKEIQESRTFVVRYDKALPLNAGLVTSVDPKNIFNIDPIRILYIMKEHLRTLDLFLKVDRDNSHFLSRDEMKYAFEMEGHAISDSALDSVMGYLDTNKDGEVDLLEFINGERRFKRQLIKEHEDELLAEKEKDQKFSPTFTASTEKAPPRKLPALNPAKMS